MSIKDELIPEYFLLATKLPISNFQSLISNSSPMQAKKQLAHQIVLELHSQPAADAAQAHFESTVQAGELPTEVPEISVKSKNIVDVLVESGLASSKSEAKRLIDQKGVRVDNKAVSTMNYELSTSNSIVSVGSRKFIKIK
ncbi:MAG: Tyrosine-tRNA ligase [Candidatus Amesbacteria bacterium GW2011_GWB1_47_26]|nr:MAG: Tyrosine-tRNA ligase [Candidatus Amesbacteria bacterium GW2011_GWB1_47_26]